MPQTAVEHALLRYGACDVARGPGICPNIRGNLARNSIIGPGLENVDFSMVKNNYIPKISESFNIQFRAEFFNALNRANFAQPTLNANTAAGRWRHFLHRPTQSSVRTNYSTQTPNRQIQLALKLIW